MKILSLILFPFISFEVFAGLCKVYGISNSPQVLVCTFPSGIVKLTCLNGHYYLNDSQVKSAFHLEVEKGANPLVFQARQMTLTVTQSVGELDKGKKVVSGTCK